MDSAAPETLYRCTMCKEDLPRSSFGEHGGNRKNGRRDGAQYACKGCFKAYRVTRMKDPEKREAARQAGIAARNADPELTWYYTLRRYGLSKEDYYAMLAAQGGGCAICGSPDPRNRSKANRFSVDHCHKTGDVRGLLCGPCNTGIGQLNDDPKILTAAIGYLEGFTANG